MTESINWITMLLAAIAAVSVIQGMRRGVFGSAKQLFTMILQGVMTLAALMLAWLVTDRLSNWLYDWLVAKNITVPMGELSVWKQVYYTVVTGLRDFPLFRFGVLFIIAYLLIRQLLHVVTSPFLFLFQGSRKSGGSGSSSIINMVTGGLIGFVIGTARALIVIMVLFIYVTLFPQTSFTGYVQASSLYQHGAKQVIVPFAGDLISGQLPVLSRAVEQEFQGILQRKYEVLDANISDSIMDAALDITKSGTTDEEKARLLYNWVGSRIQYDWDKVEQYEQRRIWKEQSPDDTFDSREGVCIDYARLYAVMARTAGLEAKVVTGLGYDGRGGYGPHAWNEVYLKESDTWIPLDATWASSGGDWFNPELFYETHIRES